MHGNLPQGRAVYGKGLHQHRLRTSSGLPRFPQQDAWVDSGETADPGETPGP